MIWPLGLEIRIGCNFGVFVEDATSNANIGAGAAGIGYERFGRLRERDRWYVGGARTVTT
jgi:hypothetical protein